MDKKLHAETKAELRTLPVDCEKVLPFLVEVKKQKREEWDPPSWSQLGKLLKGANSQFQGTKGDRSHKKKGAKAQKSDTFNSSFTPRGRGTPRGRPFRGRGGRGRGSRTVQEASDSLQVSLSKPHNSNK